MRTRKTRPLLKSLLERIPQETKDRVSKQMSCIWFRGGDCGKGLPGTPCEMKGCVAWTDHSNQLEEKAARYIGYPREIDEDSATYGKREAFKDGYLLALNEIKTEAWRMMYSSVKPYNLMDLVKFIENELKDGSK